MHFFPAIFCSFFNDMDVSENRGVSPKMDGLYWKSLLKMDDLGVKPTIFGNTHMIRQMIV